jgi:sugar phosphate isomerase/epimerase
MGNMGFYPQKAWLDRFSKRILGTHLHDVIGITDHYAPGLGEVDFKQLAGYLPVESFRTMEIQPHNTFEQVHTGLKILADSGCIQTL